MSTWFRLLALVALMASSSWVFSADGIITTESNHSVEQTADRLVSILEDKGMTVMNRINHASGAKKAGLELRSTEVIIFGNPKVGTPLMQCEQSVAIDLPQKALIWEDKEGQVWFSYNDPAYLKTRHNIVGCDKVLMKISNALESFAKAATH
jgi:uncharacterized protein (DUF302 family)